MYPDILLLVIHWVAKPFLEPYFWHFFFNTSKWTKKPQLSSQRRFRHSLRDKWVVGCQKSLEISSCHTYVLSEVVFFTTMKWNLLIGSDLFVCTFIFTAAAGLNKYLKKPDTIHQSLCSHTHMSARAPKISSSLPFLYHFWRLQRKTNFKSLPPFLDFPCF